MSTCKRMDLSFAHAAFEPQNTDNCYALSVKRVTEIVNCQQNMRSV